MSVLLNNMLKFNKKYCNIRLSKNITLQVKK